MSLTDKRVAILVHNYFEQAEFEEPLKALRDENVKVTVVSADKLKLQGLSHTEKGEWFQADLLLAAASPDDYDGLVLPGGVFNADKLRMNEAAQQWAIDFLDSGRPLAVICHATWLLVSADAVEERRLTSYYTLQDDIRNAGGEWVDMPVVIDDNLITSRQPDDLPEFNEALLKALNSSSHASLA